MAPVPFESPWEQSRNKYAEAGLVGKWFFGGGDHERGNQVEPLGAAQCRMARAALIWSLDEAAAAGVSPRTILRIENDQRDIQAEKVAAIRRAFEAAGVRFVGAGQDVGGVIPPAVRVLSRMARGNTL